MVGVIDVGLGNIKSITNCLDRCVINWKLIKEPDYNNQFDLIILPGVGSAKIFMERLNNSGLSSFLKYSCSHNQRILGICLGAQVMFQSSEEDGGTECLGFLQGRVERMSYIESNTGWLPFLFDKSELSPNWKKNIVGNSKKIKIKGRVFFNHNFGIINQEVLSLDLKIQSEKHSKYSAIVQKDKLFACQFHPEKSQELGELLIKMII